MNDKFFDRFKEPDDERPIATDWRGNDVFKGDYCFEINDVYVFEDEIKDYIYSTYGKPKEIY